MTPRTLQCEVFWSSKSSSEFSGVSEDSNPNFFQVLGFTPTLGQSRVATIPIISHHPFFEGLKIRVHLEATLAKLLVRQGYLLNKL
jgi:hypothetical protein